MSITGRTPHPRCGGRRSCARGFTLVEVLVAATLGALLLLAAATTAGTFGKQVEYLSTDAHDEAAEALADVSNEARYAWCAQVPDARHLVLIDSSGGQTTYAVQDGALTVTRPDGSQGVVSDTITSAIFTAQTVSRYREAAPAQRGATIWSQAAPLLAVPEAYVVLPGEQVGLGFMPSSPAPIAGPVAGVQEQTLWATLSLLNMKLAAVSPAKGALTIGLYRARGPGDSRPEGSLLGQVTVALVGLPPALTIPALGGSGLKNTIHDSSGGGSSGGGSGKDKDKDKESHGGGSGGSSSGASSGSLLVLLPTTSVPIDLSTLAATVQPGCAYTLVLDNSADDPVALEGYVSASSQLSGVSLDDGSSPFAAQPVSVPRSLSGTATMTRTTATPVAKSVLIELTTAAGTQVSGTVVVLGATMVDDAWLGAIPGEVGP